MATKDQARESIRYFKQYILLLFPALLVLGKMCSLTLGPNYFSDKRNIFNVYFVKVGWLWTTLAFWAPYLTWPTRPIAGLNKPGMFGVFARYAASTLWWILFTQWCFGLPIMDRIFVATGGACILDSNAVATTSSKACRSRGGLWTGGHDPSGHFFLLLQSSMLLFQENLPYLYYLITAEKAVVPWSFKLTLALLALWVWMFFTTSIYFHSFLEKLTGLAFGYVEIVFVYYLGEFYPWGNFFGIHELDTEAVPVGSASVGDAVGAAMGDALADGEGETTSSSSN